MFAGSELVFRLAVLPDVERNNREDYEAFYRNCDLRKPEIAARLIADTARPEWHPTIGFRRPPNHKEERTNIVGAPFSFYVNVDGARVGSPVEQAKSLRNATVHVYGDSYAAGEDVQYEDAWATLVGNKLGVEVANFGISGGAPDMALQYLIYNLRQGFRPKLVIISMIPENVARMAARQYCQLYPRGMSQAFKPRFVEGDDELNWSAMPLIGLSPDKVRPLSRSLMQDYWGQRLRAVGAILHAKLGIVGLAWYVTHLDMINNPVRDLRHSAYTKMAFRRIFEELSDLKTQYGFAASFVLIGAHGGEIQIYQSADRDYARFGAFLKDECERHGIEFVDAILYASRQTARLGPTLANYSPPGHWIHLSALGNEIVAEAIVERLGKSLSSR